MPDSLLNRWSNFYYIYKNWVEKFQEGISPKLSAYIKQAMMRSYFTGASDWAKEWQEAQTLRVLELEAAIRKHRDQRGDDRCWMDDEELYKVLPEGYNPPERDSAVELANCQKFIACRHNPGTKYVSPEREIERLRALIPEDARVWATTAIDTKGSVSFKFHVQHGDFQEAREALKKFIEVMQQRFNEQESCPYYEPELDNDGICGTIKP
jgi:hypothetical protein